MKWTVPRKGLRLFDLPIWEELEPYIRVTGSGKRLNADFRLPLELAYRALRTKTRCVACEASTVPFRMRKGSKRSRIAGMEVANLLYYSGSCLVAIDSGCCRTDEATDHKFFIEENWGHLKRSRR